MNELAKLYPSNRLKWIIENNKTYLTFDFKGIRFDYIVSDISECHKIIREVKIDEIIRLRGGEMASHLAHNQETTGSIPVPATF